jgi:hypothetical protein
VARCDTKRNHDKSRDSRNAPVLETQHRVSNGRVQMNDKLERI